jgi:hypothetical protein
MSTLAEGHVNMAWLGFIPEDPVALVFVLVVLALIFFAYLMLRKTVTEFTEGMRKGQD